MAKTKQKVYHLIILDKSGSMSSVRETTISGLNEQLQSIKKAEEDFKDQEQIVSLVTFNSNVEHTSLWNKSINDIQDFTSDNYDPGGMTALHDAIGISVSQLRQEISKELSNRQANVIITIFTDGQENASKEYKGQQVANMVKEIQETGQWTVAFMGCGDDVFDVAQSMNIRAGNTMQYTAGLDGTRNAFQTMANSRYERSKKYSTAINNSKVAPTDVNQKDDFFGHQNPPHLDLDPDPEPKPNKKET